VWEACWCEKRVNDRSQDEIYGSAYAAAVYLSSIIKIPKDKKVYVIGQSGLEEELRDEGVQFIGGTVSDDLR
jgi:4-nitrophenyl phosphatase